MIGRHVVLGAAMAALLAAACSASTTDASTASRTPAGHDPSTSPVAEPPPALDAACSSTSGVRATSMWIRTSDAVRLYAIEAGRGPTAVVLAHEGDADLCQWLPYVRALNGAGVRALAFDFRGHGHSESPSTGHLALGRDLAAAVARVRADGAKRVFLLGASMGGAAVVQNSSGIRVDGLISLSGTRLWPGYGVNDPAGVRSLSAPFLYVGSRDDSRAPRQEALSVFHSVGSPDKRIVLYPGSVHGSILVELPPFGVRTRALILAWIEARSK